MASSVVGLRRSFKALPKAKPFLHHKSDHNHYLVICWSTRADPLWHWISRPVSVADQLVYYCWSDPLQLSESRWNHYSWEVCSGNQWDALKTAMPAASIVQQKGPNSFPPNRTFYNQRFKSWTNWAAKSCLICHIHWLLASQLLCLQASQKLFAGKTLPQPEGSRKCFPRVHWIPRLRFLCYRNKQMFLVGKKCVDCNGFD